MSISVKVSTLGKQTTLKDNIISILSSEWPLSAKKIHSEVKKAGANVTYQAVFKSIKELYSDNILEREGKEYKLNISWIDGIEDFAKNLKRSYENEKIPKFEEIVSRGSASVRFNTLYKSYEFLVNFLYDASKLYNKTGIAQLHHLYWALSASDETFNKFKKMLAAYEKIYVLTPSKTAVDKLIAIFYKKLREKMKIKFGIDCAKDFDVFVAGDFVVQIFYDKKMEKMLHQSYLKTKVQKALGLSKLYETIFNVKTEINIVILKNQRVAEQIRRQTINYFEK